MTTITRFQAENYKRLRAVEIVPGEGAHLVPILGENAQGKSSVLDAIMAALGGKSYMPRQPVRKGEEDGAIRLELSNGLVVRRTFDEGGGGSIVVENAEGARFPSPQAVLDKLYSSVAFDPIAFTRMKPADQLDELRRLVKLDVDVDELTRRNKADYEERTAVNRDAKQLQAQIDGFADIPDAPESPDPVDEDAILELINSAAEVNGNLERRRAMRERFTAELDTKRALLERQRAALRELQRNIENLETEIASDEKQIAEAKPLPDPVDTAALTAKLQQARQHNANIRIIQERGAMIGRLTELEDKSKELTRRIEERDRQRLEAFQNAAMPVPGLSFGEGEVLFNDLPFDQASTAEQLRVSTAIGMAGNPDLRVMLVRDASLLDAKGYELLAQMATEGEFQFWVEAVDDGNKVGIVMEDGAVRGAPTPEPIDRGKKRTSKKKQEDAQAAHSEATAGRTYGEDAQDRSEAAERVGKDAADRRPPEEMIQDGPIMLTEDGFEPLPDLQDAAPGDPGEAPPPPAKPKAPVSLFDDED